MTKHHKAPQSSDELSDGQLAALLGVNLDDFNGDDVGPDSVDVKLVCGDGDISEALFATDAWKSCQAKTGYSPVEFLAQAFAQALSAGDDATAAAISPLGEQATNDEIASGKTPEEVNDEIVRGMSRAAGQ